MFILKPQCVPEWPKLAWVAIVPEGSGEIKVCHGPMVEVADDWIVEAVWAGDFAAGDFDRTDLVFGSGIRVRGDRVVFVTAGTVFDRVWHVEDGNGRVVANTLPGLLAVTGLALRDDYEHYSRDVRSIVRGLDERTRTIPTTGPEVASVYYRNLVLDDAGFHEEPKPDTAPPFTDYGTYKQFLQQTARALGENLDAEGRSHRVTPLTTVSSGYDSCASAAVAREAGCTQAVTIAESSSLWRGSDSGKQAAEALGMTCTEYALHCSAYPNEAAFWAGEGRPGVINWTQFDFPEPLCLFFTGCHGEKMWDRISHDHPDPFVRRDPSSHGFCEWRLVRGVFQTPVPFWGVRHSGELRAVTESEEMAAWCMMKDYDKPIARRLAEEAGVPRDAFGIRKKNTSLETAFLWPYSPEAQERFRVFLRQRSACAPSGWQVKFLRWSSKWSSLLYQNTAKRLGVRAWYRPWRKFRARNLIFQWANHELATAYRQGLESASRAAP